MSEWSAGTEEPLFHHGWKRTAFVRTPWGWRVEVWLDVSRPRHIRLGGGVWMREPWGLQGAFTAVSVAVWCVAIGVGIREKELPAPAEWDFECDGGDDQSETTTRPEGQERDQ